MSTKRTILSEKELNLIEEIIARHGTIVTFEQIVSLLKSKMGRQAIRNLANKLSDNGWLVRIQKGTYAIASLESRGIITTPFFKIAQILNKDSYVSLEAALQHYGMFDQMLKGIVSISLKRHKTRDVQGTFYKFINVKKELFFGWEKKMVENYLVKVATPEKAVLDMLTFRRSAHSVDIVLEKLKEYQRNFDFSLFNKFCSHHSRAVQRICGFLFDKLAIDSQYLYRLTQTDKSCSYMTKDSKEFNAKWRLYYHEHFENIQ